ncbi:ribonuclease Z [Methanocaldococcus indicus]|uniref:ribonuclease Z n=1 Tax=Methanocaldococcus indicus TaxID=213231 RepID=UPI003C6CD7E1
MITFLGTSAAVPTKKRNHIGIAFKYNGDIFLFDCGENIQRQFLYSPLSPMKIKAIFITHLHGDHILGLPGIIQSLSFLERKEDLLIFGPKGIKDIVKYSLSFGYCSINFNIKVFEIDSREPIDVYREEKFRIIAYPLEHFVDNYSYTFLEIKKPRLDIEKAKKLKVKIGPDLKRLKNGYPVRNIDGELIYPEDVLLPPKKGISLSYSGDTLPIKEYGKFLKDNGVDILIHEATYDDSLKDLAVESYHSTIGDAVKIADIAEVKSLILTHISARYDKDEDIYYKNVERYKKDCKFKIFVSEDLKSYNIKELIK